MKTKSKSLVLKVPTKISTELSKMNLMDKRMKYAELLKERNLNEHDVLFLYALSKDQEIQNYLLG